MNDRKQRTTRTIVLGAFIASSFFVAYVGFPQWGKTAYQRTDLSSNVAGADAGLPVKEKPPEPPPPAHIPAPDPLKAIYMTSWVAGTRDWRSELVRLIEETEINAVVIDIKDYTGHISFVVSDPALQEIGAEEVRISDLREFLAILHEKQIYAIARIAVFQDPYFVAKRPELAVKRASDKNVVWKDRKGIPWIDPGATEMWDYAVAIGREAYAAGFDELNYDYIRFPSDGNMNDIYYPFSDERVQSDTEMGKARILRDFFGYLHDHLNETGAVLSADLFGMTTTNSDDLGIGQVIEYALPYFDYVAPMVYPSHYPNGFIGLASPAAHPYEVIKHSMDAAVTRARTLNPAILYCKHKNGAWREVSIENATRCADGSTPLRGASTTPMKLRPWLQDFDLGADYDAEMVRAQMNATYDAGLTSWMLWDPANRYTRNALSQE